MSCRSLLLLREGKPLLALRAQLLRPGAMLLVVLIVVDLALFALHLAHTLLGLGLYGSWSLAADGGWAEVYQYLKWLWLAVLTAALAWRWREWRWLPLTAGFLFLLDTDALRTHETVGRVIGAWLQGRGLVYLAVGAAVLRPSRCGHGSPAGRGSGSPTGRWHCCCSPGSCSTCSSPPRWRARSKTPGATCSRTAAST